MKKILAYGKNISGQFHMLLCVNCIYPWNDPNHVKLGRGKGGVYTRPTQCSKCCTEWDKNRFCTQTKKDKNT